ncbi:tat protein [Simian immunodeficiency virus]|uniref:Protein Tat n=1 Tax=Simian immunodeficiency virus TaxID=11723 RepID=Q1A237_SIV|nr:tat protein [Simian immunodeficiency virus]AFJ52183.1 tat protein [Simian immunodeficiency virus]
MEPIEPDLEPWNHPGSKPRTECNKCFCKKCCYHCILCFTKKGLGISYGRKKRGRRKPASSNQDNKDPLRKQPLSQPIRDQTGSEKQKKEVERTSEADQSDW